MTSLAEVYEGGTGADLRRLYAGVVLFGVGAVLLVAGIVLAGTELRHAFGLGLYESREIAGILGGVGLPALLIGTMAVLPRAERSVRVAAFVGALVCLAGVALFRHAYPVHWVGGGTGNTSMTIVVAGVYFAGALTASWCLFSAVASFKARNDPGGTVRLEITKGGETRIVEVSNDNLRGALGGIGLLGSTPDGEVETQTNRSDRRRRPRQQTDERSTRPRSQSRSRSQSNSGGASIADGGATTDDAEFLTDDEPASVGDQYCGSCAHFRYVRTDDGMEPYCGFHGEVMADMDACDEWTPNR